MANDELMRLAAKWRAENGDYPESKRDCADELERALAQRAPLHGAVAEGWRFEASDDRVYVTTPEGKTEGVFRRSGTASGNWGWVFDLCALLAAAPAPDQYPDAGKMVGESLDGLPINDAVPAPTEIRPGNLFLWNWRAMQQYGRACIAHAASASAPEAERAEGEAVATMYVQCHECSNCGHAGINDPAPGKAACNNCGWHGDSPSEDLCPECNSRGSMMQACPKCHAVYRFVADADLPEPPPAGQPEAWRTIMAAELSERALETMAELGNFGPTVNVQDRQMKGYTLDSDGEVSKTYLSATDMRRIAADLLEAADWLDARASAQRAGKDGA